MQMKVYSQQAQLQLIQICLRVSFQTTDYSISVGFGFSQTV